MDWNGGVESLVKWRQGSEFRCSPAHREEGEHEGGVVVEGGSWRAHGAGWGGAGGQRCSRAQGVRADTAKAEVGGESREEPMCEVRYPNEIWRHAQFWKQRV